MSVAQLDGALSHNHIPRFVCSIPSQDTHLGCGLIPWLGHQHVQPGLDAYNPWYASHSPIWAPGRGSWLLLFSPIDVSLSHRFSLSLLSKINKHILGWGFKKREKGRHIYLKPPLTVGSNTSSSCCSSMLQASSTLPTHNPTKSHHLQGGTVETNTCLSFYHTLALSGNMTLEKWTCITSNEIKNKFWGEENQLLLRKWRIMKTFSYPSEGPGYSEIPSCLSVSSSQYLLHVSKKNALENSDNKTLSFFKIYFIDYAITVVPFLPLYSPPPCTPPPTCIPHFSSCPWVIYISSLASTFPILFLTSPCLSSTYDLCYLFSVPSPPLSPPIPPLITLHVISISVILFLF